MSVTSLGPGPIQETFCGLVSGEVSVSRRFGYDPKSAKIKNIK